MGLSCSKCQVVARSKSKVLQLHFLVYFSPICSKWLSVTLYVYIYIYVCVCDGVYLVQAQIHYLLCGGPIPFRLLKQEVMSQYLAQATLVANHTILFRL